MEWPEGKTENLWVQDRWIPLLEALKSMRVPISSVEATSIVDVLKGEDQPYEELEAAIAPGDALLCIVTKDAESIRGIMKRLSELRLFVGQRDGAVMLLPGPLDTCATVFPQVLLRKPSA